MTRTAPPVRAAGAAHRGASPSPLCPTCHRDMEGDIWSLRTQVRGALLTISRGGDTGLVLYHFDQALQGLACLAGYQVRGALQRPPDLEALRRRLAEARYAVVSGALAARTSPFRCVSAPPGRRGGEHATHSPEIDALLGQLASLRLAPCTGAPQGGAACRPDPVPADAGPGGVEQRGEPRTAVRYPVVVSPGGVGGIAVNLSREGAGIWPDRPLEVGAGVWVTFCRRCRLEVEGVVRWASSSLSGGDAVPSAPAAGVRFRGRLSPVAARGLGAVGRGP